VKALARAFRYQKLLDDGRYASISDMAAGEKIERGYLGTLLRLTLLAPDMVEAILNGRQPERVTPPRLLEGVPVGLGGAAAGPCFGFGRDGLLKMLIGLSISPYILTRGIRHAG
jgi:hypothetical protein